MKSIPQGISIIYFNGENKNIYAELPQDREQAKRLSKRLSTVWLAHFLPLFPALLIISDFGFYIALIFFGKLIIFHWLSI